MARYKRKLLQIVNRINELIKNPADPILELAKQNVHAVGLCSIVLSGEPGNFVRLFYSLKDIKANQIQLHTHKYKLDLTPICGTVAQTTAKEVTKQLAQTKMFTSSSVKASKYSYQRFSLDEPPKVSYDSEVYLSLDEYTIPNGSTNTLNISDIHSVSCSENSLWCIEEQGLESDTSYFYGIPFHNSKEVFDLPIPVYETLWYLNVIRSIIENQLINIKEWEG